MRWTPGPLSQNIEDRRLQWANNPEGLLAALQQASIRGDLADPSGINELPPWMRPQAPTQQAAVGSPTVAGQQQGLQPEQLQYLTQLIYHAFGLGGS
jgi:hypothetical protein